MLSYGLNPLSVQSAKAAAVKSAVVPGLHLFWENRSFLSNSRRLFLPSLVSKPPNSKTALASDDTSAAFSLPTFLAINVSGCSLENFKKSMNDRSVQRFTFQLIHQVRICQIESYGIIVYPFNADIIVC